MTTTVGRVLRGLVPAAVLVAALAGCAGEDSGDNSGNAPADGINGTVTVFAAASLTETFTTLGEQFEQVHPGVDVVFSFGGSSALAEQIRQGAPADVFASAAPRNMEQVIESGDITAGPVTFVRNRLEIAVPTGNPGSISGLVDFGRPEPRIALCAEQVPCGAAADKVFAAAGVTPRPDTREPDVKAVLTKVTLGEVDAALVYRTDIRAAEDEVTGIEFPESGKAVNDYPIAPVAAAPNPAAAAAFVDFVLSPQARSVFTTAGFDTP
ncbi:molybdate ABC transporter substrate-binding protein [Nocardia jinanensis]|uniref:Molybdate-binding protein ModA n=1 Tax=Nocardia jinanensis TaxID=382504 RepID=A0A917VR44_9NOCA|nr:molybdate ABC transporter substrate-binding protein [Nocardia jinanensis]GGL06026.1 molybdate-binding protein [Nocardia jinanensis]